MCGGSTNSRCLPSIVNGDRTQPGGVEPAAGQRRSARLGASASAGRRLQPDAVRGPAGDDQQRARLRRGPAAVAEPVAAGHLVHVEDGRGDPQRVAVAEPQRGADPRPERRGRAYDARSRSSSSAVRWLTQTAGGPSRAPAATTSLSSRSTSARWEPCASGRCRASPRAESRAAGGARRRPGQLAAR